VSRAIHRLVEAHPGGDIIAVAHGGTIRAALVFALDLDPEAALAFTIENCSITRIDRIDGPGMGHGWRVVRVNEPPPLRRDLRARKAMVSHNLDEEVDPIVGWVQSAPVNRKTRPRKGRVAPEQEGTRIWET
jgi:broad specificity phosphatase PhoE